MAMIQLQNEDSLLFWTEQSIKGKQLELLGKQFAEWAKLKYGTLEAALRRVEWRRVSRRMTRRAASWASRSSGNSRSPVRAA